MHSFGLLQKPFSLLQPAAHLAETEEHVRFIYAVIYTTAGRVAHCQHCLFTVFVAAGGGYSLWLWRQYSEGYSLVGIEKPSDRMQSPSIENRRSSLRLNSRPGNAFKPKLNGFLSESTGSAQGFRSTRCLAGKYVFGKQKPPGQQEMLKHIQQSIRVNIPPS